MYNKVDDFFKKIKGKKIALCGIGNSNLPLVEMFSKKGAKVIVCDKRERESIAEIAEKLENNGIELKLGENYLKNLDVDIIFRTPGMKFFTNELIDARNRGIVVTSEMEVFFDICPCDIIAVTGSDGKTTTTTIISEMLKSTGKKVHIGGNIGSPLLPKIETISSEDIAVVELSSFQLISMRKSPDVAVVTNLAPNHLDIHKDMSEYIEAKKNIILHQNAFGLAVLNLDNETTKGFANFTRGKTLFFSRQSDDLNGAYIDKNNDIYMSLNGKSQKIMNKYDIRIPGNHNVENYLAAISAVWNYVSIEDILNTARNFNGVEHRAEFVRQVNGVKYYNDSIASSPTRTASGTLSLYDQKIIIISGGYDKKIPFDELGPIIVEKVKLLILMGNTADKIEDAVKNSSAYEKENPIIIRVKSMQEAVKVAHENAKSGDIVSLSPACASFDMYKNFEERGKHFKELVNNL